ncbi:hypothetical protein M422DRAFT_269660 [Sphaerobolus stellatus SS14]|uniref:Uncharacterized protein n=1 Tax=Sphaerobolus stellatus (strain SS14) TaxID=990650 RepID=A0A0C9UUH3_SPHS4|nr:hypothetical protein M422DRAFT_269660 [Sphaerobolus stellatus SS14]
MAWIEPLLFQGQPLSIVATLFGVQMVCPGLPVTLFTLGTMELLVTGVPSDVVKAPGYWASDGFLVYWQSLSKLAPLPINQDQALIGWVSHHLCVNWFGLWATQLPKWWHPAIYS